MNAQPSCCAPPLEPLAALTPPASPISTDSCCAPPSVPASSCCSGSAPAALELPGFRRWHFVEGFIDTPAGRVPQVKTTLERPDHVGAALVRLGIGRGRYRVAPGLYAVGSPTPESPVLVTANYKLTFDALRKELAGLHLWILVLDTKGVNVWCAAGKKTFGTQELAGRIRSTNLDKVVSHRKVIVPQLGAPGVAGHEVKTLCGFRVVFGPVRASDVTAYLNAGMKADPAMRRVSFTARERVVVGLVEFANDLKLMAQLACALFLLAGLGLDVFSLTRAWTGLWSGMAAYFLGFFAGNILTPLALPWLPGRSFARKGAETGIVAGLGAFAFGLPALASTGLWIGAVVSASWYGMNFTGSSTYTSPSGVEKEMRRAIPFQVAGLILSVVLWRLGIGGM
ncbi:mercury methylation corrinoid protein HgcA [Fundidesulfovibrio putealis]|uniref:mercury methylation corrinoid protein HgcA n=1 Tax=Fundidesulfovibrio putealis TaxID=270496 RepID=UPI000414296E